MWRLKRASLLPETVHHKNHLAKQKLLWCCWFETEVAYSLGKWHYNTKKKLAYLQYKEISIFPNLIASDFFLRVFFLYKFILFSS